MRSLDDLPFLKSICWQGQKASIAGLSDSDILQLYERNWRYRGVIADLGEDEKDMLLRLATEQHSWIANEIRL